MSHNSEICESRKFGANLHDGDELVGSIITFHNYLKPVRRNFSEITSGFS
jgi:hypothetical protein